MKKKLLIILTSMLFVLSGCSCSIKEDGGSAKVGTQIEERDLSEVEEEILSYVKPKENAVYTYEGEGYFTDWTIFNDYIGENYFQRKTQVESTAVGELMVLENDQLRVVNGLSPYEFTYDMSKDEYLFTTVILEGPLEEGTEWVKEDSDRLKSVSTITGTDVEIETPLDTYKTIEVTTVVESKEDGADVETKEYYAEGVGLVHFEETGSEFGDRSTSLVSIEEDSAPQNIFVLFYPSDEEFARVEKEALIGTNTDMEATLTEVFKDFGDHEALLEKDDEILDISYDLEEMRVTVDISKSFLEFQNKNKDGEEKLLQALTDTICFYYEVTEMDLLIEGEPYNSENITEDTFEISEYLISEE